MHDMPEWILSFDHPSSLLSTMRVSSQISSILKNCHGDLAPDSCAMLASRRPSLVFPPLDIAERGIDLDMDNLFRTAGAASDPADSDFDGERRDDAADAGSTIALPQASAYSCMQR